METEVTIGKLTAKPRTTVGKGAARRMRAAGLIPCVLYGGGKPARTLAIDPTELQKAIDPQKKRNTLFALAVEGEAAEKVMLKDFQRDPLKDWPLHADFIRVDASKKVRVRVPLELEGKSEGMKLGGQLNKVFRDLEVECTPDNIPALLVGDVSALNIGDAITVADLKVPEGVVVCMPPQQTCALLITPRKVEEDKPAEAVEGAEGAEGEKAAEGAEGEKGDKEKGAD